MIVSIKDFQEQKEYKEKVVLGFLINYYKDLGESNGIDIPYFVRAKDTYNELIKNNKDLNYYYRKVINKL